MEIDVALILSLVLMAVIVLLVYKGIIQAKDMWSLVSEIDGLETANARLKNQIHEAEAANRALETSCTF